MFPNDSFVPEPTLFGKTLMVRTSQRLVLASRERTLFG
ncbi:hypothetical protein RISK_003643 [Rhodopirellula islandica]|uniref:Uncharacterized protein n=1 Tax=Rhodopirellula islandica TaxID=595434 RepID=A0A0J1EGC2_RHOIS|nr:hypothetical protein RISK_003643 [Rhodopirellula islandica]